MRLDIRPVAAITMSGLAAVASLRAINLTWTIPTDASHAKTRIYWSTTNNPSAAAVLADVEGNSYTHLGMTVATHYYWIKSVNVYGRADGAFSSVASAAATLTQALDIAAGAVTAAKLAIAAIDPTSGNLAINSVTTNSIQAGAVTAAEIAADAVTADHMAANSVTAANAALGDAAVQTLNIAGNAVTQAKSTYQAAQDDVTTTAWQTICSIAVTVTGTQPILCFATMGLPGTTESTALDYDLFYDGKYWKNNVADAEAIFQFVFDHATSTDYSSGQVASYTIPPAKTLPAAVNFVFEELNVPAAGLYTLRLQAARASGGSPSFAYRTVTLSMLETKR